MTDYAIQLRRAQKRHLMNFWDVIAHYSVHIALTLFALTCLVPFGVIISASLTDERALTLNGFGLLPSQFSLEAYRFVFNKPDTLIRAYLVTIFVTVVGTVLALAFMSTLAYAISRPEFRFRRAIALFVFFTAIFNGGLVPYYILVTRYLQLQDTLIILILPNLVGVFQVLLLRTFFAQIPRELFDAARVDGANEWRVFISIALPIARPALATVGLMIAIAYWNNWTTALYFIRDPNLYPLQYLLYRIMENANAMALEPQLDGTPLPALTTRMAMAVLAIGPASILFLFVQRYLVRGITLGSLK